MYCAMMCRTTGSTARLIKPGYIKYKDLNGDGNVDANDQTYIGNPIPVHIGGFSNNFRYNNFDLNIFFQWSYGNDILNANRIVFEGAEARQFLNMFKSFENRWTPENTNTNMPTAGISTPNVYSNRIIEDGSFVRLKTVALGYIPASGNIEENKDQKCPVVCRSTEPDHLDELLGC